MAYKLAHDLRDHVVGRRGLEADEDAGFSLTSGLRLSSARFARALRGFLHDGSEVSDHFASGSFVRRHSHCSEQRDVDAKRLRVLAREEGPRD